MEKLVKLLNEYEKSKYGISGSYELEIDDETGELTGGIVDSSEDYFEVTSYYITMKIISKKFGFIEQLIKRDEINLNDSDLLTLSSELGCAVNSDIVIMVLSIKDNPLEYLCKIIKE